MWDKIFHYTFWCHDHSYLGQFDSILLQLETTRRHWKPPWRAEFLPIFLWLSKPLQATTDVTLQNNLHNFEVDALGMLYTKQEDDRTTADWTTANLLHPCLPQRTDAPHFLPTFEASTGHNGQSNTKMWPDHHRRTSWEPSHKTGGWLDCSKRPKLPIYYTPMRIQSNWQPLTTKTKERY